MNCALHPIIHCLHNGSFCTELPRRSYAILLRDTIITLVRIYSFPPRENHDKSTASHIDGQDDE